MSRFPSRPRRALSALMLAWAGTWLSQPLWAQEPLAAEDQAQTSAPEYGQIPEDVLARTIEAELAAQSGQFQRALRIYSTLAAETNNLSIIQRAMRIAGGLRDVNTALDMGRRWLALEPDAVEPRQSMALQLVLSSRYGEAFDFLASLLEDGLDVDFRLISSAVARDPNASLYLDALINEFAALSQQFPNQQSLQLSLAHLYQLNDQTREALALVEKLADELDDTPEVVMLEAELLERLGETNRAQRRLAQSLRDHPDHKELRLRYARKLLEARNFKEAKKQFAELAAQNPRDYDILYSLALLSLEENLLSDAKNYLQRLVQSGQRLDDAYYYLGYIAAQENDIEAAIEHYRRVRSGANFLPALRNFTELMVRTNRYSEAKGHLQNLRFRNPDLNLPLLTMEANVLIDQKQYIDAGTLLNSAVGAFPDNVQLLFLRSVLSQETNDLELMEKDLRRIIELNPDNPVAYNSLGYILADRTQRYQEAYELIKKAVELAPDDPAIIDSLGWVQYRLGMLDEARINLNRAYQLYPDHEVAAHLGEVMWMQGDRSAATRLWRRALEEQPDSEYIRQTMQRLGASP
jgi:Flp pilus assembly protein TadD, contains TPR repeats